MKREIKFRYWNKDTKQMYQEIFFKDFAHNNETIVHEQGLNDAIFISGEIYELMQYTGLKDKNGKEIYEGDIVQYLTSKFIKPIEYQYGGFLVGADSLHSVALWSEIIGNIYENPDLLK